jgi:hypothetical protein
LADQNKTIRFIFVLECDNVLYNTLWALKISTFLPGVFAEAMEKLTGYLFGLGEAFHDAVQIKCEMEDEARAEYASFMEYYDGE